MESLTMATCPDCAGVSAGVKKLTVGSLFAGIGGIELGLERTGGFETKWQVEIEDYANRVLERHWPNARRWRDIKTFPPDADATAGRRREKQRQSWNWQPALSSEDWHVDLICGGFPCQDISYAGKGSGLAGERSGLFYEAARVIRTLGPRYVLLENVAALLTRGLGDVLGTLASLGYDCWWNCIQAADVGAPHIRDRIFIIGVAHAQRDGRNARRAKCERQQRATSLDGPSDVADSRCPLLPSWRQYNSKPAILQERTKAVWCGQWSVEPDVGRVVARISNGMDGGRLNGKEAQGGTREILRALRSGDDSQTVQWPSRGYGGIQEAEVLLAELCEYKGSPRPLGNISLESQKTPKVIVRGVWFHGLLACPSCRRRASEQRAKQHSDLVRLLSQLLACDCGATWLDPSGTPSESPRVDRLRCLGNAVVPQVAQFVGEMILDMERCK
jgi:DNA (cytosine-5)-methyltransferase 1